MIQVPNDTDDNFLLQKKLQERVFRFDLAQRVDPKSMVFS
jgi:hypothetical protein